MYGSIGTKRDALSLLDVMFLSTREVIKGDPGKKRSVFRTARKVYQ